MMRTDDKEFEAFYRRNYASVYWFYRRAHVADDEAHDLAQDVFTNVLKSWHTYRRESVRKYLETVARRLLLDRIRRSHTWSRRGVEQPIDDPAIASRLATPPDAEKALEKRILYERIDRLHPVTRACVLHRIDGHSYEEIADLVRISLDAVKTRLRDAKQLLKEEQNEQL